MPNTPWKWKANLTDSTEIVQIKNDGTETNFKEVLDAESDDVLESFFLTNETEENIGVNLRNGNFYLNGTWLNPAPELEGENYRIVFYRRMQGTMHEQPHVLKYLVGWQTTIDGTNHQRIMFLDAKDQTITIKMVR